MDLKNHMKMEPNYFIEKKNVKNSVFSRCLPFLFFPFFVFAFFPIVFLKHHSVSPPHLLDVVYRSLERFKHFYSSKVVVYSKTTAKTTAFLLKFLIKILPLKNTCKLAPRLLQNLSFQRSNWRSVVCSHVSPTQVWRTMRGAYSAVNI